VWEWCEDDFAPFPGFREHPMYDDFSTPCFDGRHHVIIGGSFISTGAVASRFGRYEFRPHFFQHAGFRLVMADDGDRVCDAVKLNKNQEIDFVRYQTETQVNEFMLLHYGSDVDNMPYAFGPVNALNFHCRTTAKLFVLAQYWNVRMEKVGPYFECGYMIVCLVQGVGLLNISGWINALL
jgi:hypothetical protein